jgi:DNA-binding response OmpR family regulator
MAAEDAVPLEDLGARKIVVIDDDPHILSLIGAALTSAGYRVFCAEDAAQGVEAVRRERPVAVICDIIMPGMDGYEVHRALYSDPAGFDCAFLFVSGQADFSQRVRAFGVGGVDFMAKPFTPAILIRKVERLLTKARPPRVHLAPLVQAAPAPVVARHAPIPMTRQPAPPSTSELAALPAEMRRVLVVDDVKEYRDFARQFLGRNGFTVFEAQDGESALKVALDERPWLVLVDVHLPGMDGFELCRRFRSQPLLRHLAVVFLSAHDDYADRRRGYEAGGDEYLPKLTQSRELLMRICLLLGRMTESVGWTRRSSGMQGDIDVIGPAGVLQMFHLGRLSGTCHARNGALQVQVRFRDGEVVGAIAGLLQGQDAIFSFLSWEAGRFEFTPGDPGEGDPLPQSFSELLLEGCRRLDEMRRIH